MQAEKKTPSLSKIQPPVAVSAKICELMHLALECGEICLEQDRGEVQHFLSQAC